MRKTDMIFKQFELQYKTFSNSHFNLVFLKIRGHGLPVSIILVIPLSIGNLFLFTFYYHFINDNNLYL